MSEHETLGVYDYERNKLCDLYDSQYELYAQAYDIVVGTNWDGSHTLEFKIPYVAFQSEGSEGFDTARYGRGIYGTSRYGIAPLEFNDYNFRWGYMQSDLLILYTIGEKKIWFVASKPQKTKQGKKVYGLVTCNGYENLLKTKSLYKTFDDENGIGTIGYIMEQILSGTGWTYDSENSDTIYENNGVTEKIRSMQSDGKKGALDLITTACNLFQARPVYDTDQLTVTIKSVKNREQVLEGEVGRNLNAISVKHDSSNIATRIYVEGEYGDYGYVGIDDVIVDGAAWGLPFVLNFDYYREIGMFKQSHETALATYLSSIRSVKAQIMQKGVLLNQCEDDLNTLIGQCKFALYYKSSGYITPAYKYGGITDLQALLTVGDDVVVLKSNNTLEYTTWPSNPTTLMSSAYGVAKFVTKPSGKIGAAEVQIEAKQKEIANLQQKINSLPSGSSKIAEYQAEITRLNGEISAIQTGTNGLYAMMHSVMKSDGLLYNLDDIMGDIEDLNESQDEIEETFVAAMGIMLRDGYWGNDNYIVGQEQFLYNDAIDMVREMSRPSTEYSFDYVRVTEDFDIAPEDIQINAIFKLYDAELQIEDTMFIKSISYGVDNKKLGKIEVSNQDITLTGSDLGTLLGRISQIADLIEQKNALYERAKAISQNGTLFTDRLNGQIDVLKTQFLSTVSNWYTDENGNIIFLAADGSSAMMLCGAGFMIASSKDAHGEWNWRTFGSGEGFTADEIIAGFISAERIEAGTITANHIAPNAGNSLVISGNPSITNLNNQIAPAFSTSKAYAKGDYVMYNGTLYKFTKAHSAGAWNASHVAAVDVCTQIELLPDAIISTVSNSYIAKTTGYSSVTDIVAEAQSLASAAETAAKGASIAKTTTYQTAAAIYNAAVTQAGTNASNNYIAKTTTYQTAASIYTAAQTYTNNQLTSYSTTSQTSTAISTAVGNCYGKISGITITADGINMTGSKYIKLISGNVRVGDWYIDSSGLTCATSGHLVYIKFGKHPYYGTGNYVGFWPVSDDLLLMGGLQKGVEISGKTIKLTGYENGQSSIGSVICSKINSYFSMYWYSTGIEGSTIGCLGDEGKEWNEGWFKYCYSDYFVNTSSREIKHNIEEIPDCGEIIDQLTPVTFIYNNDEKNETHSGLIYEDTVDILPDICTENRGVKGIRYPELVPYLLKEIQSLRQRVAELETRVPAE